MKRLRRQRPFLESILNESNRFERQELLEHANADQINAISEMTLNLLKKRIPVHPSTLGKPKRHKGVLRELAKRKNSLKRMREHLEKQTAADFGENYESSLKHVFVRHQICQRLSIARLRLCS